MSTPLRERALIALAAASRFAAGILMGTGLAFYIGQRGGSDLAVGLVSTAYFLGFMLFAPLWGAVADVTGRRRTVLVGTGVAATLTILPLTVVDGTWAPIGIRGLYAAFAIGFAPVMFAYVSEQGGRAGRGRSLGYFNSARAVGFSGGQLSVGFLLGVLLPAELYLVIAGVSLVSVVAIGLVAENEPRDHDPTAAEVVAELRRRLLPAVDDRAHLRKNGLQWLYVALVLRNMCLLGVMSLMPVYLPRYLGMTEFQMGALLALNPAGQVVFMLLFGRLADSYGRRTLITTGMAGSGAFGLLIAAASLPTTPVGRLAVAAAAFVLIAASFSALATGSLAFIGDVAPPRRESELMGLRQTARGLGGVLGPIVVGVLATLAGYEVAFAVASLLAFGGTAVVAARLVESGGPGIAPTATDFGDD